MKMNGVMEGLAILKIYFKEDGYTVGAEHDQIHVYATDWPIEPRDLVRLNRLGWYQIDDYNGDNYKLGETWVAQL